VGWEACGLQDDAGATNSERVGRESSDIFAISNGMEVVSLDGKGLHDFFNVGCGNQPDLVRLMMLKDREGDVVVVGANETNKAVDDVEPILDHVEIRGEYVAGEGLLFAIIPVLLGAILDANAEGERRVGQSFGVVETAETAIEEFEVGKCEGARRKTCP
jgi:hypothetical protein